MVHYYCFIENGDLVTAGTKVFKVKIGSSRRDQIKRTLVDCYATDTQAFFRIWDVATDYHLAQIARFKPVDCANSSTGLNIVQTDIHTLYRNILDGSLSTLENPDFVQRNLLRASAILSPSFFFKNHASRRHVPVPAVKRKNLSYRPTDEDSKAAVGFGLLLLLYWLGSLVGCWERAVL